MELPADGQEYAHITFSDLPDTTTVDVSIDSRTTWHATEDDGTPLHRRVLLRGPQADRTEGLTVDKTAKLWVRVADNPETIVRVAGTVYLV